MHIPSVSLLPFSPTRTTRTIVQHIAHGIDAESILDIDLTTPDAKTRQVEDLRDTVAILGAPVYAGRVPVEAIARLGRIRAHSTPAIIVVVYGNRAYEDALLELRDIALERGFVPIAAGAFVGEHSFSTADTPIAVGRPDPRDIATAEAFGRRIAEKVRMATAWDQLSGLTVPGNHPYRERPQFPEDSPETDASRCVTCGTCATVCPTAAITVTDTVTTDKRACLICCACVKACPTGARTMTIPKMLQSATRLSQQCRERKEPETFFAV